MDYEAHQKRLEDEVKLMVAHREALIAQLNQRSQDMLDRYTQLLTANKLKTDSAITELVKSKDFL